MPEPVDHPATCPGCGGSFIPADAERVGLCPSCAAARAAGLADTVLGMPALTGDEQSDDQAIAPPPLRSHLPPPPPLPDPSQIAPPARSLVMPAAMNVPVPAPASLTTPPLRVTQFEGPDHEEHVVPMLLDRTASEPNWAAAPQIAIAPTAPLPGVIPPPRPSSAPQPAAPVALPLEIARLPLPAELHVDRPQTAPAAGVPQPAFPTPIETHGPTQEDVRAVFAARARRDSSPDEPRHHPVLWALAGMAATILLVLGVLIGTHQVNWFDSTSWEAEVTPQVRQLKGEAENLVARGALRESHEKYRQIETVIAGREIHDAPLQQMVDEARKDARRVYDLVLAQATAAAQQKLTAAATSQQSPPTAVAVTPVSPSPQTTASARPPASPTSSPTVPAAQIARSNPVQPPPASPRPPEPPPQVEPVNSEPVKPSVAAEQPPPPRVARRRPDPQPIAEERGGVTDEQIGQSIQAGVDYLLQQFDARTKTVRGRDTVDESYGAGMDALVVYALLQAGQAINDPRLNHRGEQMRGYIDAMKGIPMTGSTVTYARGLRATCIALFNRPEDFKTLQQDVDQLLGTTEGGAYTYHGTYKTVAQRGNFTVPRNGGMGWDNSNAQYGLLGVWSGADAESRIEVPLAYWKAVERHWSANQNMDGTWSYGPGGARGRLSMTCAGIASLFVAHEYIEPPLTSGTVGREPFPPALKKGLAWFEQGDNSVSLREGGWWGYALYGIERVGLASGFKHFGTHDWYRELAARVVRRQQPNGSWGDGIVDTSYAILFLSRGRHPIMMNKLRFDGYWSNRPRDAANIARFAGRQLERPLNWQVVNVDNPWTEWTDSPILYIASHEAPKLTDEHLEKLEKFVEAGGMLFTHADAGSPAFDKWARELATKLFKKYEMQPISETHPLWSTVFKISNRPQLFGVSNGSRLLMLHSPSDIALKWQQRADRPYEGKTNITQETKNLQLANFQFGVNLFVYAAGKRDLRNRLDSSWIEQASARPIDTVRIGRIRHDGNWDPEPGAWKRYVNWFQRETGTLLEPEVVKAIDLRPDMVQQMPLVHLTGTARAGLGDADVKAIRDYVQAGGVVLIDSTGGLNAFDVDMRTVLTKTFPQDFPRLLDNTHPIFSSRASGMSDLSRTRVRSYVTERMGSGVGTIQMLVPKAAPGQRPGAVIITSLDLTSGMLGTNTWGILGFEPAYAQNLVKNIIFWTLDGTPQ